jgi:ABC-type transporter Mla subunit MlaD
MMDKESLENEATIILQGISTMTSGLGQTIQAAEANVGRIEALYTAIEARLEAAEGLIDRIGSAAGQVQSRGLAIAQLPNDLQQAIENLPDDLEGMMDAGEQQIADLSGALAELLDEAGDTVRETAAACGAEACEQMTSSLETVQELLDDIAGEFDDRMEEVLESVEELHENADELVEELFEETIPEAVGEQGAEFLAGVQTLRETGLEKLEDLDDALGAIQDKTKVLINFVDSVKPVLEIARQI